MKLHHYTETDSVYIELSEAAATVTRELAWGLNADFDCTGRIVGLDIDGAALTSLKAA